MTNKNLCFINLYYMEVSKIEIHNNFIKCEEYVIVNHDIIENLFSTITSIYFLIEDSLHVFDCM